jgi:ketosteroid isomerase-like protein
MRSNRMPLLCLVLLAPTAARCARPVDTAAEERVLRDLDKKWVQATLAKDTIAIGNVYAEDAEFLPPNQPAVSGRAAIRTAWGQFLRPMSHLTLSLTSSRFVVSPSGDFAYDAVTYTLGYDLPNGKHYDDVGKGVAVWKKVNGQWKAALDIFNSDKAAAR